MHSGAGLSSLGSMATKPGRGSQKTLTDGSHVAVIGAGPAGSIFSYFLLKRKSS
jgi:NADPH-dependent glutamate synthase beta subunit-like oxidoreductase